MPASPRPWNQLPESFRHTSYSSHLASVISLSLSALSQSVTYSLLHCWLKTRLVPFLTNLYECLFFEADFFPRILSSPLPVFLWGRHQGGRCFHDKINILTTADEFSFPGDFLPVSILRETLLMVIVIILSPASHSVRRLIKVHGLVGYSYNQLP